MLLRSWTTQCWIPIVKMNISIIAPPSYGRGAHTAEVWSVELGVTWDYHNKILTSQKVGSSQLLEE